MKTRLLQLWRAGILALAVPLASGCAQNAAAPTAADPAAPPTNATAVTAVAPMDDALVVEIPENAPPPERAEPAPGSEALPLPSDLKLSPNTTEVVKLARSGVDEAVMLAFVTNSTGTFNLGSDQIVYLNDLGVASEVLTLMIEHDRLLREGAGGLPPIAPAAMTAATQPVYTDSAAVATAAAPQPLEQPQTTWAESPPAAAATEAVPEPPANVTYNYFYNSLSPYGTWMDVEGYGYCWQPSAAVSYAGWRPYVHGGRWIYSTYGWYWHSDYSWGWAPFHYGRWFSHPRWGWCWRPDTIWGPSWVSWRYTDGYCGWAPLPPAAMYTTGFGFSYYGSSVGISFGFGLASHSYAFVPWQHFHSRHYHRHHVHSQQARTIYNNSTVVNNIIVGNNNTIINRGIEVDRVSRFTRTEIQPVRVREVTLANNTRLRPGERLERGGRELVVQRPRLPETPAAPAPARMGRSEPRQVSAMSRPGTAPATLSGATTTAPLLPRTTTTARAERSREQAEQNRARVETALRSQRPAAPAPAATAPAVAARPPVAASEPRDAGRQERPIATPAPRSASALLTPSTPAPSVPTKSETTPPKNEVMPPGSVTWIGRRESAPAAVPRASQPVATQNVEGRSRPNTTTTWTRPAPEQPRTTVTPRVSAPTFAPSARPAPVPSVQAPSASAVPRSTLPQPAPVIRREIPRVATPAPSARTYTPPVQSAPRVATPPAPAPRVVAPMAPRPQTYTPAPAPSFGPRPAPAAPSISRPSPSPAPSFTPPPRVQSRPAPAPSPSPSRGAPSRPDDGRGSPRSR